MQKVLSSKKSGFSLIELSIVLIIIGLLVAAITGGASLVKSAELRAVMAEARGFQVAVNSFFSQFDALPGDFRTAIGDSGTASGSANNQINFATENHIAWLQLRNAAVIDGNMVPTPVSAVSTALVVGTNMPASKLKSAGWAFESVSEVGVSMNAIVLTGATVSSATPVLDVVETTTALTDGTSVSRPVLTTIDALSIDSKVDDGRANTGNVIGINTAVVNGAATTTSTSCQTVTSVAAHASNASNENYRTAYTTAPACALAFKVDPS